MKVIKKDGTIEEYTFEKIKNAVTKSAKRVMIDLSEEDFKKIEEFVTDRLDFSTDISIYDMHNVVEAALEQFNSQIAKSYKDYRDYKMDFVHIMDQVYTRSQSIRFLGDKENANSDSALVATKRCLIFNELNKRLYRRFFMTRDELQACKEGYIYIHDQSARLDTMNCCLCDVGGIMKGGFEMGNVWYNEPKTLDTAFDVIGDIILSTAAQQYGGFTVPEIDKILAPYAKKSYEKYYDETCDILGAFDTDFNTLSEQELDFADKKAMEKVKRDFEQGWQGIEMKLNTVGSSRGDYPFITMTFGLATDIFGKMASKTFLQVHAKGQGKKGSEKPVLFPKLVFLYDEKIHGPGGICEDIFEEGVECSCKTMYPDWLSLSGDGYVASMYQKYGRVVSPMGCVDGKEVVTYRYNGILYVESFERMWGRVIYEYGHYGQKYPHDINRMCFPCDINRVCFPENNNLYIWDTRLQDFTKVHMLIRNVADEWCDVTLSNEKVIRVTYDHPFETENRGVVHAEDLKAGDAILVNTKLDIQPINGTDDFNCIKDYGVKKAQVLEVNFIDSLQYSYDVTTVSEHFEVSGVYSHNCRAFLSPWYERGGMKPADDEDKPVFVGRFNIGAVSLHLPMILAKSRQENRDFYEVLDYYLEMIRRIHQRTFEYLGEMKASTNPIQYCEGGFYGGHLQPHEKIKPLLKPMTASFGITALNELQELYNGKSLVEDGEFALEVMKYINEKVNQFKEEDGWLYALYGTPAESLASLQIEQFRKMYGVIEGVSDRPYVSNSFHCHVTEDITPIEKQDLEGRFWDLCNGGKIQYVRYPIAYNKDAVRTLIRRAMKLGYYEGVNLSLAYCDDCGHRELEMDICPKCGSKNLTKIDRMNGYLAYSRVHGDTRLNAGKMAEITERKSM